MKLRPKYWVLFLLLAITLWFGWVTPKPWVRASTDAGALHILNRLSFGAATGDIEAIKSTGVEAYIQSQLSPESIPSPPQLKQRLAQLETLSMSPVELFQKYGPPKKKKGEQISTEELQQLRMGMVKVRKQAVEAHLLRAIASPRQLQEVMVDFWFNHFNVFLFKGRHTQLWVGNYETDAIRPHALGRFRDLLGATARHPAMLVYLDNWLNTAPNSPGARGRFKGLNENYARELMELHTLGVDGGYTQDDVVALARILTGWGIAPRGSVSDGSAFDFNPRRHDYGEKVFLGTTIKGSGFEEVEQALDILARHPSTARYISYKLAQYFVADEPPASLVETLAQRFLETDGDIRAVLDTLFHSREFSNPKYYNSKYKTPYQYVISLVRATRTDNPNLQPIIGMLNQMGMPIYGCKTPNGYKNTQEAWLNPDGMQRRVSFAIAIANGRLNNRKPIDAKRLAETLGNNFSPHTQQILNSSPPKLHAALMLGSPEMMNR